MHQTIFLCSLSKIKQQVCDEVCKIINSIRIDGPISHTSYSYGLKCLDLKDLNTPSQPCDEGTAHACFTRIRAGLDLLERDKPIISQYDKIVAIENGTYKIKDQDQTEHYYDVCVLMVGAFDQNGKISSIVRYNSFGIKIDNGLYTEYLTNNRDSVFAEHEPIGKPIEINGDIRLYENCVLSMEGDPSGYTSTFGSFLSRHFGIVSDNWMSDPRFGNTDRRVQIRDALEKFMIDQFTDRVPDYPKKGVLFKHMTPITIDFTLFKIMIESLKRMIRDNFDVDNIDYFAGLDARGFYTAPVLAIAFNKGFIPVRKANKIPKSDDFLIATESYGTEYSTDEFGLEYRSRYFASPSKRVLIFDDLLATGGSLVGAANVLRKVGLEIAGAVTIYDVPALRHAASTKLKENRIPFRVLVSSDNLPNDTAKHFHTIPDIVYERIRYNNEETTSPVISRHYTMEPSEWCKIEGMTEDQIQELDAKKMNDVRVIYTEKDKDFALKILDALSKQTGAPITDLNTHIRANITSEMFSNGETRIKIDANIRKNHIFIMSRIRTGHVNDDFMELILIMDACSRAGADKITVVMPYYPYSRSDKKDDSRSPIGAAVIAKLLGDMRADNLISVDLHAGQIQGYLDTGFHNLYIKRYMCEYIYENYLRFYEKTTWNDRFILIAPDAGSAKAVKGYSSYLGINNIILDKQRDYSRPGTVMRSRMIGSKDELEERTGFIIDDMADTMGTMCAAAKELVDNGLKDVVVFVTHGILSGAAIERINTTPYIKEVIVTDTLPQEHNVALCPKLRVMSCAELVARAIDGILTGRSISRLF